MSQTPKFLEWSAALDLGVPQLDAQHRALMDLVNRFADQALSQHSIDRAASAMEALLAATREHFAFEEALMQQCGFPDTAQHLEQHAELLASMERLWQRLQREHYIVDKTNALSFMRDWFLIHILHSDSLIVPHLPSSSPTVETT